MSRWIRNKKIKALWKRANYLGDLKQEYLDQLYKGNYTVDKDGGLDQLEDMILESNSVYDLYNIQNDIISEDMGRDSSKDPLAIKAIELMCKSLQGLGEKGYLNWAEVYQAINELASATSLSDIREIGETIEIKTEVYENEKDVDEPKDEKYPYKATDESGIERAYFNPCERLIDIGNKGWGSLSDEDYLSYIGCLILNDPTLDRGAFLLNLTDVYNSKKVKETYGILYDPNSELTESQKSIVNEKYKTLSEPMKKKLDSIIDPSNQFKL